MPTSVVVMYLRNHHFVSDKNVCISNQLNSLTSRLFKHYISCLSQWKVRAVVSR